MPVVGYFLRKSMLYISLLLTVGLLTGLLSGMLGIGGGVILMPTLFLVFSHTLTHGTHGIEAVHLAINTSLALTFINSMGNTWEQFKSKRISLSLLKIILPGTLIGVIIGSISAVLLSPSYTATVAGCLLILLSFSILIRNEAIATENPFSSRFTAGLWGVTIGAPSSFLGIGGGSVLVPVFNYLGMDIKKVVGSSAAFTLITSGVSLCTSVGISLLKSGHISDVNYLVNWNTVLLIFPIMLLGVYLGSKILNFIPNRMVQILLLVVLLTMGSIMLLK